MSGPCPLLFIALRWMPVGSCRTIQCVWVAEWSGSLRVGRLVLLTTKVKAVLEEVTRRCLGRRAAASVGACLRRRRQRAVSIDLVHQRCLGRLRLSYVQQTCGPS